MYDILASYHALLLTPALTRFSARQYSYALGFFYWNVAVQNSVLLFSVVAELVVGRRITLLSVSTCIARAGNVLSCSVTHTWMFHQGGPRRARGWLLGKLAEPGPEKPSRAGCERIA